MNRVMFRLVVILLAGLLFTAAPVYLSAQKTPTTQKKTNTTPAKKPTTTPAKKPATTPAKKPTTTPAKKPTTTPAKKPAATTTKKPAATSKPAAQPRKRLSRAEYEKQQRDLQKQIEATQKMINENDKSVRSRRRDIQLREEEIGKRRALIISMQHEIETLRSDEDSLQRAVEHLSASFLSKQKKYEAAIRHIYKWRSGYEELLFIFSAQSMTESVRRLRYLNQYSAWRKQEALELQLERQKTEDARALLAKSKADRQALLGAVEGERQELERKQELQNKEMTDLQKRRKELSAELERDKKRQQEIQKQIQALIDEERRKANEERRKAELAAKKKAEAEAAKKKETPAGGGSTSGSGSTASKPSSTSPTYTVDDSYTRLTGNFRQNKGKMPYPVDTPFAFLQHYKQKNDGNLSIRLSTGVTAHACAVFEGRVTRCSRSNEDWTVIVSHGDYMSVYSNLENVNVQEGQTVKMRQVIGKIKPDSDGRRGELMFWIYGRSDAENPELWLRK